MADIRAFRGLRYDLARVGALSSVIAPPYDVIDETLSKQLHDQSPYNVIRLILNPIESTDDEQNNRYTRAAKFLHDWRSEGILTEDSHPCIYVYSQQFDWEGTQYTRRGVMARVRLEKLGEGKIYPHEETMPGPKADRLKLFHATGMNLSQIFGLYPDEANEVGQLLDQAVAGKTPLEATDHLGVVHRVWPISDLETITKLQGLLGPKPVFIADGHHRYETSCKHLEERQAAGKVSGPEDPANFTLMMFVGMSEPGLKVMPTHRLVSGLSGLTTERLQELLQPHFDIEVVGNGTDAATTAWESIETSGRQEAMAFCTVADGNWILATLRSPSSMDQVVTEHSDVWKSLGVSILHKLALDTCLASEGQPQCKYVHLLQEVIDAVQAKQCDLACLVQPATVEHIRQLAGTFEKMPAKSTYFYPKLASGLVFNPIH